MKKALRIVADIVIVAVPAVLRDGLALAGASSIAWGAGMIYRPAGFIAAGALVLAGLALNARGSS